MPIVAEFFERFPHRMDEQESCVRSLRRLVGLGVTELQDGRYWGDGHGYQYCSDDCLLAANGMLRYVSIPNLRRRARRACVGTCDRCDEVMCESGEDCTCRQWCNYCDESGHEQCRELCEDCDSWCEASGYCAECDSNTHGDPPGCPRCSSNNVGHRPTDWCNGAPIDTDDIASAIDVLRHLRSVEMASPDQYTIYYAYA